MRRSLVIFAALLAASPAYALKVTNLDNVPHRISFTAAGNEQEREIAPNGFVRFEGTPSGRLSLITSPAPSTGGTINSDGVLSGIIGNGRDQGIPADQMDEYVIWPGGKLRLQKRIKQFDGR